MLKYCGKQLSLEGSLDNEAYTGLCEHAPVSFRHSSLTSQSNQINSNC